jgi:hypothetical protein
MCLRRKILALLLSGISGCLLLGCSTITHAVVDSAFDTEQKDECRRQEEINAADNERLFGHGAK